MWKNLCINKKNTNIKKKELLSMTTIIGIKCIDGIVIASDTQSSFYRGVSIKRLNAEKIHLLPHPYVGAIAGAGSENHIKKTIGKVSTYLENYAYGNDITINDKDEIEDILEDALIELNRKYNLEKSNKLGYDETQNLFDAICVFCMKLNQDENDDQNEYEATPGFLLYILHPSGADVEPIDDYATIGSGAAFAEYLLGKLYQKELTTKDGSMIAQYVIHEVTGIEPNTGGDAKVVILNNDDEIQTLSEEDILYYSKTVRPSLDKVIKDIVPKIICGKMDIDEINI
jgi:20S proteasome alpha/beta subunit